MQTIEKFIWTDEFQTGISEIDKEHKKLFEIYNDLVDHFEKNGDKEKFVDILTNLSTYVRTHLNNEEAYLKKMNYPHLKEHLESHLKFALKIAVYNAEYLSLGTVTK
jgi:hemerythrin